MPLKISEAFALYRSDHIAFIGQSKKTEEAYYATSVQLMAKFGDVRISTLTFDDIRDWKIWLDMGRSPNTVRNYIVCLRSVLRFLEQKGFLVQSFSSIPVPKRKTTEMKYLTEEEMREFIQEVGRKRRGYAEINRLRNVAIVETLYATGLRNSELCSLNRSSIKNNSFTVIGKGNKPRICFINDHAIAAIDAYLALRTDSNRALFVSNQGGGRITSSTVREIFVNTCARSSFKEVHPHTIRHSYATKLLMKRVDIRYVKEFMGHANLDTTAMYTHVVNEDLKEIYEKAHVTY